MRLLPGKYGVHSPFVFHLITRVIEERASYYRLEEIALLRKRLFQREMPITKKVRREAISLKKGALLFRLANFFKPQTILQVDSSFGLSTLYLSSYAPDLQCISIVPETEAEVTRWVFQQGARTVIDLRTGSPKEHLSECLPPLKSLDFVFLNAYDKQNNTLDLFLSCMPYAGEQTLFVIDGIRNDKRMRETWQAIIAHPEVTVTLDLRSIGLVFLNKKLHKQNYKIYW